MSSQDDNFGARDRRRGLRLHRERELDEKYIPAVICHIVLLDGVNSTTAFISAKNVDVRFFEDNRGHGAPLLIKLSDSLPLVLVNRVAFARIKHSVDRPASDRVHEVSLVSERMRVPTLKQHCFLLCCFVDRVVHEYLARHVCKRAVKSTCDQDAAITESNGHSIALQKKVVWHKLLRPQILGEVILQDELRVV